MSNRCNSVGGHGEGQGLGGADSGGSGSERGLLWPMEGEGRNQRARAQHRGRTGGRPRNKMNRVAHASRAGRPASCISSQGAVAAIAVGTVDVLHEGAGP
jgi:hypothetical protein